MPMMKMMLSAFALLGVSAAGAQSRLTTVPCEFDEVYQYQATECEIEFRNQGDDPIRISAIRPERSIDAVPATELLVPPRGVAHLKVTVSSGADVGFTKRFFSFSTDEPDQGTRYAEAKGFVDTVLDENRPEVDFGIVDLSRPLPPISLEFPSREESGLRVLKVVSAPPYVDVRIRKGGSKIEVVPKKDAPWGIFEKDIIKLSTNSERQKFIPVRVKADFRGMVVPALNPIPLGYLRTNVENELTIRLSSTDGADFSVGDVLVQGFKATARVDDCIPVVSGCKLVKLAISSDQPTGQLGGLVRIQIPKYRKEISVYAWGMLLKPEVEIVDLVEEMEQQVRKREESASVDLSGALRMATAQQVEAPAAIPEPPPGRGPLLRWSVENESLLYGFVVYRSNEEKGSYRRANEKIIRTHEAARGFYQWRDTTAAPGSTYWYYVASVDRQARKSSLTEPMKVTAK